MNATSHALLSNLQTDYPSLRFECGSQFYWSSKHKHVVYTELMDEPTGVFSLLHEVGHALLGHSRYSRDYELLKLEIAAWERAKGLGQQYGITIDEEYVQDCLDTYRDWIHSRSRCPQCSAVGLQTESTIYECINCQAKWSVSRSRLCRLHRRLHKT
jgi:hypothetical protein